MTNDVRIARLFQTNFYSYIQDRFTQFPAVVLLGARKVGKTTLVKQVAKDQKSIYLNL